ncbi:superinfection immunity protein [Pseudidiomarina sp. 1APP75-27a]|uniref:superinfection immunity protein n=1 Tax=Pseudidiomarina terrestris TaxID=2820060 RepID=UPI002B0530E9|nr:superinfection immunity protein [Pseudidiomarina sp. 1APP75-27a]MEA3588425.1 superinfection immunity protein [Pseudidiomarina sp. 1APP75-27a]
MSPLVVLAPAFILLYFLPTILAFCLNRKHKMKILAANIPAGLSWFLWLAVLTWAFTGKEDTAEI